MLELHHLPRNTAAWRWAIESVRTKHYLRNAPDPRTSFETFGIRLSEGYAGVLIFGRPEATRCADWYGSVGDVLAGKCQVTRWQVLCLSRVWIDMSYQRGGERFGPSWIPGYIDRRGEFRSTLVTAAIALALHQVPFQYLAQRPPCFLDEPYQIRWILSYCDTSRHKGIIYRAAGFELFRTNSRGIQTWRIRAPELTEAEDDRIRRIADIHPRSVRYRADRSQLSML